MHHVPHRFPFEWIDSCEPGRARLRLTSTGPFCRAGDFPAFLSVEILAQACLSALLGTSSADGEAREKTAGGGLLAGIDTIRFLDPLRDRPLAPGDVLDAEVELAASFGKLVKVQGTIRRDGVDLLEGSLLLALA